MTQKGKESMEKMEIEIEREDDGRFIAEIVAVRGALAYGQTEEEARANVKEVALQILFDNHALANAITANNKTNAELLLDVHAAAMCLNDCVRSLQSIVTAYAERFAHPLHLEAAIEDAKGILSMASTAATAETRKREGT